MCVVVYIGIPRNERGLFGILNTAKYKSVTSTPFFNSRSYRPLESNAVAATLPPPPTLFVLIHETKAITRSKLNQIRSKELIFTR